ncbi:MAG: hypothetical protein HY926_15590 [Elusimicrobia bacterium]|nr:hypothetical protein [Elusimicrobiota bacterium]
MSVLRLRKTRSHPRFLIDLPLTLWDRSHHLIDSKAEAHDVTAAGFGFETRGDLERVGAVYFELQLPGGESVSGTARVAWRKQGGWGTWGGAHILTMSRRDRRRIHRVIHGPGYDWGGLANRAVIAALVVILAVAVQKTFSQDGDLWVGFPFLVMGACFAAVVYFKDR